jgi:LysM repeat protein
MLLFVCLGSFLYGTGDSTHFLTNKDTIFLNIDFYGEKIFTHHLEKKQTVYSLAKFYGLNTPDLFFYNPDLDPTQTSIGQGIRVPIPDRVVIRKSPFKRNPENEIPVFHKVKKGETLYRISKSFYHIPMDTLALWNQLDSFSISIDQDLFVGVMKVSAIPDTMQKVNNDPFVLKSQELSLKFKSQGQDKLLKSERGAAFWHKDQLNRSHELYALHREAEVGSVILVANPMTRKTAYVRVLGKIPDSAYPENIKLVLSARTAKILGAIDERFFVEIQFWKKASK